jgi:hypothetical protein
VEAQLIHDPAQDWQADVSAGRGYGINSVTPRGVEHRLFIGRVQIPMVVAEPDSRIWPGRRYDDSFQI